MKFKSFLLNEHKYYLGQKAGDLLTALQNLAEDAPNLGNRALIRMSQGVVNQIRRVLHGRWDDADFKYLKSLQKVGVAIMKAIDEKDDLSEVLTSGAEEVQGMLNDLEVPINNIASPEEADGEAPTEPLTPGSQIGA